MSTSPTSKASPISSVLETCLYARDLDAAVAFYGEVLGLETISHVAERHAFFRCGRQMVLVFNPETTSDEERTPHGAEGASHVAFAMDDASLDAWRRRLRRHGIAIEREKTWGPDDAPRGRSLYLRDPAGNSVELATPSIWFGASEST